MKNLLGAWCLALMFVAGCGYTTGSLLPSHLKTVFVKPVENKVDYMNQDERKLYLPGMETRVRTALIDRFLFDGNLRVGDEDTADLVVTAQLLSFNREDVRLTEDQNVKEYRLRVTVAIKVVDSTDNDKVLWEDTAFSGESTYYVSGPLAKAESVAVEETFKDLAQRVVARTIEDW
ncbi:MAG: LptE family protein [Candidatus Omnitrophica bacterium]|nr:LptE family protein [Candidatus Omnitrophota bacterium]